MFKESEGEARAVAQKYGTEALPILVSDWTQWNNGKPLFALEVAETDRPDAPRFSFYINPADGVPCVILGGEMTVPLRDFSAAFDQANGAAEACGYLAQRDRRTRTITCHLGWDDGLPVQATYDEAGRLCAVRRIRPAVDPVQALA